MLHSRACQLGDVRSFLNLTHLWPIRIFHHCSSTRHLVLLDRLFQEVDIVSLCSCSVRFVLFYLISLNQMPKFGNLSLVYNHIFRYGVLNIVLIVHTNYVFYRSVSIVKPPFQVWSMRVARQQQAILSTFIL